MKITNRVVVTSVVVVLAQVMGQAHFKLLEPASWLVEDQRGDPQKAGPCGGSNTDWGKPSYAIGQATGGQKLHLKVQETIYHPGHYRVALAVNSPTELPLDPKTETRDTDRGPWSVSAVCFLRALPASTTRDAVLEAVVQRLDLSQKQAADGSRLLGSR